MHTHGVATPEIIMSERLVQNSGCSKLFLMLIRDGCWKDEFIFSFDLIFKVISMSCLLRQGLINSLNGCPMDVFLSRFGGSRSYINAGLIASILFYGKRPKSVLFTGVLLMQRRFMLLVLKTQGSKEINKFPCLPFSMTNTLSSK